MILRDNLLDYKFYLLNEQFLDTPDRTPLSKQQELYRTNTNIASMSIRRGYRGVARVAARPINFDYGLFQNIGPYWDNF